MKLTALKPYIQKSRPDLQFFLNWLRQLIKILLEQPEGCLVQPEQFWVTPDGRLKLLPVSEVLPGEARNQVWSIGRLFLQWLAWSQPQVRQEFAQHQGLRRLLDKMTSSDPHQRPSNLEVLRVQLEQARPGQAAGTHPPQWLAQRNHYGRKLAWGLTALVSLCCLLNWLVPSTT